MQTIIVTESNLSTLRTEWPALDQRDEIAVGDTLWTCEVQAHAVHGLLSADGCRAGVADNGDTVWGDVEGELRAEGFAIVTDDGVRLSARGETLCSYRGCSDLGLEWDADGDHACAEHAAKSEEWVITTDLEGGAWVDAAQAERMERALAELGWDVTIRAPRGREAEGTHTLRSDGTLQWQRTPESLRYALDKAHAKTACAA